MKGVMDTPFFREIKPYSRGGNDTKNAKGTYHFMIEFTCRTTSFEMASVKHNELTHGVCSVRISPFISPFLHTNPGFFEPFSSIIVDLGYLMGIVLASGIPSAGLRRRVVGRRVIFVIGEKGRKACRGRRCVIICKLGGWQEVLPVGHFVINKGTEVGL